jgi:hypothetical protein
MTKTHWCQGQACSTVGTLIVAAIGNNPNQADSLVEHIGIERDFMSHHVRSGRLIHCERMELSCTIATERHQ